MTLASAVLLASVGMATAQTVVIEPERETVIREYVTTHQVEPAEVPSDVSIEIGATLAESVALHAIEALDADIRYRYVVVEDRTVLVKPETREVVHIIE